MRTPCSTARSWTECRGETEGSVTGEREKRAGPHHGARPSILLALLYGVPGHRNVLQLAKNVRELSLMYSVAENTCPLGVPTDAE